MLITIRLNGVSRSADLEPDLPLLYWLRGDLGLRGPRFGCGQGQCGACTVLLDGEPVQSCVLPVRAAQGLAVTTLEGLGTRAAPHPLQLAFQEEQAMQCGYCSNGMILAAAALLRGNPQPSREEIIRALDRYLCRCGSHNRIIRAVQRAAGILP